MGKIVGTKISVSNMWSNVKIDDYQISCLYWKVNNLPKATHDKICNIKACKGEHINMFEQN